jgi:hypothetical protein
MSLNGTERNSDKNDAEIVLGIVMVTETEEKIEKKNLEESEVENNENDENLNDENYFSEMKKKIQNMSEKDKNLSRTEILYKLHKKIIRQREEICEKGEMEKNEKDLAECTFSPKISKMNTNKNKQVEIQFKNTANQNYVDKKKKQREKQSVLESQSKFKVGSGNNWTKDLTVPTDMHFKTEERIGAHSALMNHYHADTKEPTKKDKKVKVSI